MKRKISFTKLLKNKRTKIRSHFRIRSTFKIKAIRKMRKIKGTLIRMSKRIPMAMRRNMLSFMISCWVEDKENLLNKKSCKRSELSICTNHYIRRTSPHQQNHFRGCSTNNLTYETNQTNSTSSWTNNLRKLVFLTIMITEANIRNYQQVTVKSYKRLP